MEEALSEAFAEEIFKICFEHTISTLNKNIESYPEKELALYRCFNLFKKSNTVVTKTFVQIASEKRKANTK